MKRLILSLAILFSSATSFAVPHGQRLSDAAYLRKLSLTLKGTPPDAADYTSMNAVTDPKLRETFFRETIKRYMTTPAYRDRMVFRMSELFQVAAPEAPLALFDSGRLPKERFYLEPKKDAMTDLFARIASQNLSWDQLLVAKDFNAFAASKGYSTFASDLGFWSLILPQLPSDGTGVIQSDYIKKPYADKKSYPVTFAPDDVRIAGALTTARFSARYNTTVLNKNRKRAAAVFKIFLCDAMTPNVPANGDKHYAFVEATFPENFEVTEEEVKALAAGGDKHGTDKDCMACHYKLDPLGKVFQTSALALHPRPASGALSFTRLTTGELINTPVKGIGELATAITQQPEYETCQVKWFWKQFVGRDQKLTANERPAWVKKFNAVGRKTNDFVLELVTSDAFRTRPIEPPPPELVTFDQVEELLQRCDSCHAREMTIPQFSTFPIGGTQMDHEEAIKEMISRLDRLPGDKKKMPKESAGWKTSDVELVRKWLSQGARDEFGKPTIQGVTP